MLDDLDLQLINALEIAPRSRWSELGPALGTDASTLSRRWSRLTEAGLAWTTCYVLPQRMQAYTPDGSRLRSSNAVIEIRCEPGRRADLISALAPMPAVISVECTSGFRDLVINISAASPRDIDRYVSDRILVLPGVVATSTRFVRRIFREGSEYDLAVLGPAQRSSVEALQPPRTAIAPAAPSLLVEQVIRALQPDARRTASEIAREVGISVALARRTVAGLAHSDWVRMRADFAHDAVGWNASVHLWLATPQDRLTAVAEFFSGLPTTRLCAATLGTSNVVAVLWMRELDELDEIEIELRRWVPEARVTDRLLIPRTVKRMGTLFDEAGRRSGYVPVPQPGVDEV